LSRTSPFRQRPSTTIDQHFAGRCRNTGVIVAALRKLRAIYRPDTSWPRQEPCCWVAANTVQRAGWIWTGGVPERRIQRERLTAMDQLSQRYGRGAVQMASGTLAADPNLEKQEGSRRGIRRAGQTCLWREHK
jgi:hypothetical protein